MHHFVVSDTSAVVHKCMRKYSPLSTFLHFETNMPHLVTLVMV